jgi:class 3 adenylate cyclase
LTALTKQDKTNNEILSLLTQVTELEQKFQKKGKNTIVFFADLEGSTHYKTTHTFFESLRKIMTHNSVISDIIKKNHGEVIKWLGDGIMARFSENNTIKSIETAVEINQFFLEYNKNKSKEDKINTKIGISVGRCLDIDNLGNNKNDLMGIAVDTASRIQALAKPGQILIDYELKLRIKNLAVNKKKKQNAKEAWFSFGAMKLRNLRGIGPVKIAEVRWNKLLDIKREEDDFTKEQLKELATILSKNNEHMILDSSTFCKPLLSDEEKQVAVRNCFQNSKNIIRILAYSLSSWKERIEKPLLDAIK